jgi:Mn2+/Fe2+ NRAMP family transporter
MADQPPDSRSPVVGPSRPRLLSTLGPGLISGAATDDPCAIATYAQTGARFGFGLLWLMPLAWPLMIIVQQISARIGRTTGTGLAGNIARHAPRPLLIAAVLLILVANVVAIAADLSAMGDVMRGLVGGPHFLWVALFGGFAVLLQVFLQYTRYVAILKWTTLSLLAYIAAVLVVGVPWGEVAIALVSPRITAEPGYLTAMVAIFGVALSPYLFFWQASQEVEDQKVKPEREPLLDAPEQARPAIQRIQLDTLIGMAVANLVGVAIILTTATTLHANGTTEVTTSAEVAEALRPVAGPLAFAVFSLGIIGTGLLAIPVLAGSAAYAIGEALRWPVGLSRRPLEARAFYLTLATATTAGIAANLVGLDPLPALFWSAVVNGVVAAPLALVMVRLASDPRVMGEHTIGWKLRIGGWLAGAVLSAASVTMLSLLVLGKAES